MDFPLILFICSSPFSCLCNCNLFFFFCLFFVIVFFLFFLDNRRKNYYGKLPQGPSPYPIIGNILELGTKPHQSLAYLSKTYGPLMTLKLGSITTIVISSPEVAKEALHKNEFIFSGRTIPHTCEVLDHHKYSLALVHPSSAQWKTLRRVCVTKIFSPPQLQSTEKVRSKKLQDLLDYVDECCSKGEALDIGEATFAATLNSISNTLFSIDLVGFSSGSSREFKDLICGILEEAGSPNVSDFFPFLRLLDPQRKRSRMNNYFHKVFKFIENIVEERIQLRASKRGSKVYGDVLDSFLDLMEEENSQLRRRDVLHLLVDLFDAGADSTSSTVEWAMTELLKNTEKLRKLREELQEVIGNKNIKIEESHISNLPFLRAVVKETLRLHPPAPFLVPRMTLDDAQICGFTVPKSTQVLVNTWAIGRDSSVWCDSNLFKPERFLESKIDFKGRDFELIPFGAGRRMCPGLPLAFRTVHLMLAMLLQNHDWELPDGLQPNDLDMDEKFGLTLRKVQPLRAMPIKA